MNDFDYLLDLPGEERERRWLQERLETLSVREGIILAATAMRDPPGDMTQAINCLQSLNEYEVRVNVGSYEALGHAYLRNETKMPKTALLFADLEQTGRYYENRHPGLFVGNCYVEYTAEMTGQEMIPDRDAISIEDAVIANILCDRLQCCLALLDKSDRLLIQALYFDGLSEREFAAKAGLHYMTVHNRKARLLRQLKKMMEK